MRIILFAIGSKAFRIVVPEFSASTHFPSNPFVEVEARDARGKPQWRTAKNFGNDQLIRLLALALYAQDRAELGLGEYAGDVMINLGFLRDFAGYTE
jgi:hypothetical protein